MTEERFLIREKERREAGRKFAALIRGEVVPPTLIEGLGPVVVNESLKNNEWLAIRGIDLGPGPRYTLSPAGFLQTLRETAKYDDSDARKFDPHPYFIRAAKLFPALCPACATHLLCRHEITAEAITPIYTCEKCRASPGVAMVIAKSIPAEHRDAHDLEKLRARTDLERGVDVRTGERRAL